MELIPSIDWEALKDSLVGVDEIEYLQNQLDILQRTVENATSWFNFTQTLGWIALGLSLFALAYMIVRDMKGVDR